MLEKNSSQKKKKIKPHVSDKNKCKLSEPQLQLQRIPTGTFLRNMISEEKIIMKCIEKQSTYNCEST